jgi:hypothetical protein
MIGTAAKPELQKPELQTSESALPDHRLFSDRVVPCTRMMLARSENTTVLLRHMDAGSGSGSSSVGCGARLYATTYSLHALHATK